VGVLNSVIKAPEFRKQNYQIRDLVPLLIRSFQSESGQPKLIFKCRYDLYTFDRVSRSVLRSYPGIPSFIDDASQGSSPVRLSQRKAKTRFSP